MGLDAVLAQGVEQKLIEPDRFRTVMTELALDGILPPWLDVRALQLVAEEDERTGQTKLLSVLQLFDGHPREAGRITYGLLSLSERLDWSVKMRRRVHFTAFGFLAGLRGHGSAPFDELARIVPEESEIPANILLWRERRAKALGLEALTLIAAGVRIAVERGRRA